MNTAPPEQPRTSVVLTETEFVAAVRAVGARRVVGVSPDVFDRPDEPAVTRSIEATLDRQVLDLVDVVAHPRVAWLLARDTPHAGRQFAFLYERRGIVVQQTFPEQASHRIERLGIGSEVAIRRTLEFFPLAALHPGVAGVLDFSVFLTVKHMAEHREREEAIDFLTAAHVSHEDASDLLDAFAEPAFGGTISVVRCSADEIVDGRDMVVAQGPAGGWAITQAVPGESPLLIERASAAEVGTRLMRWAADLGGMDLAITLGIEELAALLHLIGGRERTLHAVAGAATDDRTVDAALDAGLHSLMASGLVVVDDATSTPRIDAPLDEMVRVIADREWVLKAGSQNGRSPIEISGHADMVVALFLDGRGTGTLERLPGVESAADLLARFSTPGGERTEVSLTVSGEAAPTVVTGLDAAALGRRLSELRRGTGQRQPHDSTP